MVSFAPKGGTVAQGLTMNYTMERRGNEWYIKKRAVCRAMACRPPRPAEKQLPGHPHFNGARRNESSQSSVEDHRARSRPERLASAGVRTVVFDEKLASEKPCGGGLTYKADPQYPFLSENIWAEKGGYRDRSGGPESRAVTLALSLIALCSSIRVTI